MHLARLVAVAALAVLLAGCGLELDAEQPTMKSMRGQAPGAPTPAPSDDARPGLELVRLEVDDESYDIVSVDLAEWDVRLEWYWEDGGTLLSEAVERGNQVQVATNAGIFTTQVEPGGLLVSDGVELRGINLARGGGNFHLLPNAVFAIYEDGTARVMESNTYESAGVVHATQSGPALLLDGTVHPEFKVGSTNLARRSGVGVSPDGATVYLVMSNHLVNFHSFAMVFQEHLGVRDALYLDGNISGLWVRGAREYDAETGPFAGIITVSPRD